jgi:predicted ATPase
VLILDNLEQLVSAAADLGELLARTAGLEFLVTSRTVLGLGAEHEYPVAPLPLPPDPASATGGELAAALPWSSSSTGPAGFARISP